MPKQPNPVREDGHVLQHFVPVPSLDTPEEILEHYRQRWSALMLRQARLRNTLPTVLHPEMRTYHLWKKAYDETEQAKREFDLVNLVVESYRFAVGNGTMVAVKGRHGGHKESVREVPLTNIGHIHLWRAGKKHNILCEDDASASESAVEDINHVECQKCRVLYWLSKRNRKARRKRQVCSSCGMPKGCPHKLSCETSKVYHEPSDHDPDPPLDERGPVLDDMPI